MLTNKYTVWIYAGHGLYSVYLTFENNELLGKDIMCKRLYSYLIYYELPLEKILFLKCQAFI